MRFIKRIGFLTPIIISLLICIEKQIFDWYLFLENSFIVLLIILISKLFKNKTTTICIELIGLILFNVFMLFEILHFYLFKEIITSSTIFIFFEANNSEFSDFISMYIDHYLQIILAITIVSISVSVFYTLKDFRTNRETKNNPWRLKILNLKIESYYLIILLLFTALPIKEKILPYFLPLTIYIAHSDYTDDLKKYEALKVDKNGGDFTNIIHQESENEELYVLVIGESTTRSHMQLYGYERNTNPMLMKQRDSLIVFNDVIAPHTHSLQALNKVLTLADYENPDDNFKGSIIQLFNKVGFTSYWISNQKPAGIYETAVTGMSNASHEQIFVSTTSMFSEKSYDENILPYLKKVLRKPSKKKFVIIHLMGTHLIYSKRYPEKFNKFASQPNTIFRHEEAFHQINSYDNAVLYNDFILNEIIKEVSKVNSKSFIMYLSDHGEDVYQTMNSASHTERNGSKPMYDIPFILWFSDEYKNEETNNFRFNTNLKYNAEDLIFTISDLANINYEEFDATKSLVNFNFIEKPRYILDGKIYDEYFKNK